jgi:hypothetical protein
MLSSIHPLGERARSNRWGVTVTAHVVGSVLGGALVGALLGAFGWGLATLGLGPFPRLVVLAALAVAAALVDAIGWPAWLWRPRRQVDENWLVAYRGWVYGVGYGFQLGLGVATIVTAATVYALGAFIVAVASVPAGLLIGTAFGLGRGLSLVPGHSITSPDRLVAFHRRLQERAGWGKAAAVSGDVLLAAAAVVAATTTGWL